MRNLPAPRLALSAVAFFLALSALAQEPKKPNADDIIQKYLTASGGPAALEGMKSVVMKGTLEIKAQNVKADMLVYRANGGKSYSVVDIPGMGKQEEGANGGVLWEKTALGPRLKSGVEKFLLTCAGDSLNEYSRLLTGKDSCYDRIEVAGQEPVNGKPAWKLVLTPKMGKPEEQYFDLESGLLVQEKMILPSPLGELPVTFVVSKYQTISGLATPMEVITKLGPVEMQLSFREVTYNAAIPDQIFALPPDIQAMVEAEKKR
ncbi:MAG: hypothetical protein OHK0021_22300 [Bryobacter sp.]